MSQEANRDFRTPHSEFRIPNVGHDVTAASRPVTADVPVQVRLTNPISMTRVEVTFEPVINAVLVRAQRTIQGRQETSCAGGGTSFRPPRFAGGRLQTTQTTHRKLP